MSLYVLYKPDGSIHASTKVYADDNHKQPWEEQLIAQGEQFLKTENPGLLPPAQYYVHNADMPLSAEIRERPTMRNIMIDKTRIECGDNDACTITGIPQGAMLYIAMLDGRLLHQIQLNGPQAQLSIPVPMTWRVTLEKFPYQNYIFEIEAFAP